MVGVADRLVAGATDAGVLVDRTTQWGNPWVVRRRLDNQPVGQQPARWRWDVENVDTGRFERACDTEGEARELAVRLFAEWTLPYRREAGQVDLGPLVGRDLACWCPEGVACHADVLLAEAGR